MIDAVRQVSKAEIVPRFRSLDHGDIGAKRDMDDLVTVADRASEAALTMVIKQIMPDASIVGEEAVSEDATVLDRIDRGGQVVVIDPIDGTWNYANGLANYGVILAVVEEGETMFGLLYDPMGDDWVIAAKGQGAWFGREGHAPVRLSVSDVTKRAGSFGFLGLYLFNQDEQAQIAVTLPEFRRTMTLRCSCHEYRMIAQGRVDFVLNGMLNVWDHAAGVLALQEAGGVARLLDGRAYAPSLRTGYLLTACTEEIWAELAELWSFMRS